MTSVDKDNAAMWDALRSLSHGMRKRGSRMRKKPGRVAAGIALEREGEVVAAQINQALRSVFDVYFPRSGSERRPA